MAQVEESIEVHVPVNTAHDRWTRFESFPKPMGVERIEQRTQTLTHRATSVGGVEREFDAQITERIPDERFARTAVGGEAEQAGVVTSHRLDGTRTEVVLQMDFDPDGPAETVGDKPGLVREQVTGDLEGFEHFLETRGQETGARRGSV
ncbi:SRPBCC family protein [Streptomyces griseomycini]|uniref:Membrane protein n=1 Tax=Streptomyces griseomycini TaxID=66895 RepID=A0A7W7LZP4_9ACTN|nr:SRPBCC family protein [Streptomyces griseomycini]MBB4899189.1 putative membrane protein [Streptomyces griseomycini]GGR20635.1 hypothetical protein GCM10015536_27760 [Streptomyces griseomycini]